MKIHELITLLQQFDVNCEVIGTWESITAELDVYQAKDGRVMVDVDGNAYKNEWQNGTLPH